MAIERKRTLSGDLIFWLTTTIILLVTVISTAYFTYSYLLEEKELEKKATKLTNEIAKVSALPLWDFDSNLIQQIAHAYLSSDFIVGIKLMADKDIVFESFPANLENTFIRRKEAILPTFNDKTERIQSGAVEVIFTRESIRHAQISMIRTILIILAFVIIIIICGTRFIMRFLLNRPLDQLIRGIQIIARGEYSHPLELVAQTDLNNIIKEVNVMAKHIAMREKEMQRLNLALTESENKYRSIFENAAEGIFQTHPDGHFLNANMSMARIMGYSSPEELMRSVTKVARDCFVTLEDIYKIEKSLKEEGMIVNQEIKLRRKDGSIFWANQSVRAVYDKQGNIICNEGSLIDITARKEKEKAERERKWAEAKTKAKSDFLANMSHEIRTPMNAVIGFTELALKTDLTAKQNDYLTKIKVSSLTLLGIINDILDFSKIEAGKLEMESIDFNLHEVFENVVNIINIKAEEKGLELLVDFDSDVPEYLIGDPLRLSQILINLVGNAVKFTHRGEVIIGVKIEKSIHPEGPGRIALQFSVKDTGIGLKQSQIEKLFAAFSQADQFTTRKYGGTGLGLTISKHLCEMMGGTITVTSTPDVGSRFVFTAVLRRQSKEKKYLLPAELSGLKTLLVDDNRTACRIITAILNFLDLKVIQTFSGEEAWKELKETDPAHGIDLLIIDWHMPDGMSGIETAMRIKAHPNFKHIPIILMVSVYRQDEALQKAGGAVDVFLTKPVNRQTTYSAIMTAMGKTQQKALRDTAVKYKNSEDIERIRGAHILIAEDIEINQQVIVELLKSEGIKTTIARDGLEAVEMICNTDIGQKIDAVLMDIQMPNLDGYQATRKIRSDDRFADLPIIAMTAHAMVEEREKCLRAGMNDHATKPIEPEKLYATLAKWITPKQRKPNNINRSLNTGGNLKIDETTSPDMLLPEQLPGINIPNGLKRVGGNRQLFHKLLLIFLKSYSDEIGKIADAIDNEDYRQAQTLTHAIKGASGNIGAEELYEASKSLEKSLKTENKKAIGAVLEPFFQHLEQVLTSIAQISPLPTNPA